jgi:hypothetical protein
MRQWRCRCAGVLLLPPNFSVRRTDADDGRPGRLGVRQPPPGPSPPRAASSVDRRFLRAQHSCRLHLAFAGPAEQSGVSQPRSLCTLQRVAQKTKACYTAPPDPPTHAWNVTRPTGLERNVSRGPLCARAALATRTTVRNVSCLKVDGECTQLQGL